MGSPSALRVVVIGEDDISAAGCEAILARRHDVGDLTALSHADAWRVPSWAEVDVVVLDPLDVRATRDQLGGIAVAERIRAECPRGLTRIVVLCDVEHDDVVRIRAREAGVDRYHRRSALLNADVLCRIALDADAHACPPPPTDLDRLVRLGVTRDSRVNAGVAAAFAEQLVPEAGWVGPRGRDRFARRVRFNAAARLRAVSSDGLAPDREQTVPSLAQIRRFVVWATQVRPPSPAATDWQPTTNPSRPR